jgi:hypothetical protein
MSEKVKKICIGIPHTGIFHWQTLSAVLGLAIPKNYILNHHLVGSCLIYDARENIVKHAKSIGADYLLFMDSDMVPPADMLQKMVFNLESNSDFDAVSGMAFKRTPPFQPCFYTDVGYDTKALQPRLCSPIEWPKNGGLMQIQGCGMACCMLKMDIFDRVGNGPYFFPLPNLGEDLTFCLKMKSKGMKMYVDLSIDCGHVATMPIQSDHFIACYEERKRLGTDGLMFTEAEGAVK